MLKVPSREIMNGFTIIELLIATTIFSLVLLGALAGFLRAGNLFYKGVSLTQTQGVAKQVMDDVSANIANSSGVNIGSGNGYNYYCIGNTRYTYRLNVPYLTASPVDYSHTGNFGLLRDTVSGCPVPCVTGCAAPLSFFTSTEMLGDNMRLAQFSVAATSGSKLYTVNVAVAYGDNGSLNLSNPANPTCNGSTETEQFCAVSVLSTSVYAGISI